MNLPHMLLAMRLRWRTLLAVAIGCAALIFCAARWTVPVQYRATAEVLVDDRNADPIAGVPLPAATTPSQVATQVDVLLSERVLRSAVRAMKLEERSDLRTLWKSDAGGTASFEDWVVERLRKKTEVRPSHDSRVITVAHVSTDPAFAAGFSNALVKAYMDTALELRQQPLRNYNAFFTEQARQARDRLEQAQRAATDFQRTNGITTTDEKQDMDNAQLAELSSQVSALQASSGEALDRQKQAQADPGRLQEILRDPVVSSVSAALLLGEVRWKELTSRLGPRHPQVVDARASLDELRTRLAEAKRQAAGGLVGARNVSGRQLAERTRALELQQEKILQRKSLRDHARVLQSEADSAQRAYEAVLARVDKTALESLDRQLDVSVLKWASVPRFPRSLSAVGIGAAAAVAGVLFALLVLVVAESNNRRLRTLDDVQELLAQPLLGRLPRRRPPQVGSRKRGLRALVSSTTESHRVQDQPHLA